MYHCWSNHEAIHGGMGLGNWGVTGRQEAVRKRRKTAGSKSRRGNGLGEEKEFTVGKQGEGTYNTRDWELHSNNCSEELWERRSRAAWKAPCHFKVKAPH